MQVLQWYVVLPDITLDIWFTFLSLQLLISGIPVLSSRDLISIGASLEVSNFVDIFTAGIAGILVAHSVLYKLLNLALHKFIYPSTRSITQFYQESEHQVCQALNSRVRKQLCDLYSKDVEKLKNEFDLNISHW